MAAASVHINLSTAPDVQILCGALAWVYLLFLAYLLFVYRGLQHRKLVGVVESIGLLWFVLGALWLSYMTFAAIGLFVSAVLLFWAGNKALHETAVMRSKAAEPAAQPDGYATS